MRPLERLISFYTGCSQQWLPRWLHTAPGTSYAISNVPVTNCEWPIKENKEKVTPWMALYLMETFRDGKICCHTSTVAKPRIRKVRRICFDLHGTKAWGPKLLLPLHRYRNWDPEITAFPGMTCWQDFHPDVILLSWSTKCNTPHRDRVAAVSVRKQLSLSDVTCEGWPWAHLWWWKSSFWIVSQMHAHKRTPTTAESITNPWGPKCFGCTHN